MCVIPHYCVRVLGVVVLFALTAPCFGAGMATWQGGSGRWATPNWGLAAPEGYPGDPEHHETSAEIDWEGAEVAIESGDAIDMAHLLLIRAGGVKQTGGSATFTQRLDVRGSYALTGGTLTSNVIWILDGGTMTIEGGELVAPEGELRFLKNQGALTISGGRLTVHNMRLGEDETSLATVRVVGSDPILNVASFMLHPQGGSATADFVFDKSGIAPWNVLGGGGALNVSTDHESANLTVNVTACRSDGTEGFALFRYSNPKALVGDFGPVTVTHGTTRLKPASGTVKPGEYRLDMGATENAVTLYFNNATLPPVKASARK